MHNNCLSISHKNNTIQGTVQLTGSKSECNRALIIQAVSKGKVQVNNISNAADTVVLTHALELAKQEQNERITIDIGPAGTAMRFLTSYLSLSKGSYLLTGTQRMQERPIGILTAALEELGAQIDFDNRKGYPPLKINGGMVQKLNEISINGNISSQYITALLLIAPSLPKGLTLNIKGELTSRPYVTMTLNMMSEAGIQYTWVDNTIQIKPQEYRECTLTIEPDWSAASYWYALVALSESGEILLKGLKKNSLQGDSALVGIMPHFGVITTFVEEGILLQKKELRNDKTLFDFKECPDIAQTIVVIATALKKDISLTGLETLKIKETDRIAALQNEIAKYGGLLIEENEIYHLKTQDVNFSSELQFATYEDHRMAMAFAPLALMGVEIKIEEPEVVDKSYPDFWKDLQKVGFNINTL